MYTINQREYIITVNDLNDIKTTKNVYSLSGSNIINNVIDQRISKNKFSRKIGNILIEFSDTGENNIIKKI